MQKRSRRINENSKQGRIWAKTDGYCHLCGTRLYVGEWHIDPSRLLKARTKRRGVPTWVDRKALCDAALEITIVSSRSLRRICRVSKRNRVVQAGGVLASYPDSGS